MRHKYGKKGGQSFILSHKLSTLLIEGLLCKYIGSKAYEFIICSMFFVPCGDLFFIKGEIHIPALRGLFPSVGRITTPAARKWPLSLTDADDRSWRFCTLYRDTCIVNIILNVYLNQRSLPDCKFFLVCGVECTVGCYTTDST